MQKQHISLQPLRLCVRKIIPNNVYCFHYQRLQESAWAVLAVVQVGFMLSYIIKNAPDVFVYQCSRKKYDAHFGCR
jgi:hypothetical protein